ncbi:MAG: polyprenyl diphosphate synthase [Nanoarchaeota archaeon]
MHLGIIMDGNRRYAKQLGITQVLGYEKGVKKVEQLLEWSPELGIKELTLYTFSMENFNRPMEEKSYLMDMFRKKFTQLASDTRLAEHQIRIRAIGRTSLFPADIQDKIKEVEQNTKHHKGFTVNFAMAYGGRTEIIDMVRAVSAQVKNGSVAINDIDEDLVENHLYMNTEPDIIIRTGGAMRTSNFLPWQSAYSEWCFHEKKWPELSKEDIAEVIDDFRKRERRFGK